MTSRLFQRLHVASRVHHRGAYGKIRAVSNFYQIPVTLGSYLPLFEIRDELDGDKREHTIASEEIKPSAQP